MEELEKNKLELVKFCLDFERFEKSKYLIDCIYHQQFGKLICEDLRLAIQLDKYTNAIGMRKRGDEIEDIRKMISTAFVFPEKEYNKTVLKCENVIRNSPVSSHLDEKYLVQVEDFFVQYCSKFHPILRTTVTQIEESSWNFFTYFYRNNNLEGMKQIATDYEKFPRSKNAVANEVFIEQCIKKIKEGTLLMQQQATVYPYNKKEIIEDDMKIAREAAFIRERINEKNAQILKLKKEYDSLFGNVLVF